MGNHNSAVFRNWLLLLRGSKLRGSIVVSCEARGKVILCKLSASLTAYRPDGRSCNLHGMILQILLALAICQVSPAEVAIFDWEDLPECGRAPRVSEALAISNSRGTLLGICFWREGFEAVFGPEQRGGERGLFISRHRL